MTVDNVADSDNNKKVDPLYHQCKTAHRTSFVDRLVGVSNDGMFGTRVTSPSPHIGHLTDHNGLCNTFHCSRIKKGHSTVNQSMSLSFDPSCVSPVQLSIKF